MRNIGVGLIVAVYAVLLFTSSSAPVFMRDTGFVGIRAHAHFDPMMVVVTIAGVALAAIPVRRGERWARLTTIAMLTMVLFTRFTTSGQRLVVLNPNQHGYGYSLIIAAILGVAGLALTDPYARGVRHSAKP
jgi:hypothetical protein